MEWFEGMRYRTWSRSGLSINVFSQLFCYYAVPVAIGILSLLVSLYPAATPAPESGVPLAMRILSDPDGHLGVDTAALALRSQPLQTKYDTRLSEAPIWFEIHPAQSEAAASATTTLFPSRHIQQIACFDAVTQVPLGSVSRTLASSGEMTRSGSGIALVSEEPHGVICRAIFSGPAVLSASRLSPDELKRRNDTFYRRSGLLEGGLVTLAAFVLITAIVNRDWVYVLFAAWLFGNLRLGAISMGWDDQWLGYPIPFRWISLIRKITVPVYYILTCTLFQTLFRNDLSRVGF
ncbi:MAG: hypothetical protein QOC89_4851, partial [Paraburkholderia sp.]|nr:hypothetical protein [Paraburkholderia sp.]